MMCYRIGIPPISIMGLGLNADSSEIRVPKPPARMTTFIIFLLIASDVQYKPCLPQSANQSRKVSSSPAWNA